MGTSLRVTNGVYSPYAPACAVTIASMRVQIHVPIPIFDTFTKRHKNTVR